MKQNDVIDVFCFGIEVGRLRFDLDTNKTYFQYNKEFLESRQFLTLFPPTRLLRRTPLTQVFSQFNTETFKGIPPMFADSLPDVFGNKIFKAWVEHSRTGNEKINIIEQLAYVANRGMGALEYRPGLLTPSISRVDINEIIEVLKNVLSNKKDTNSKIFDTEALLNIFKIGTSAGGARPKILISEDKETGEIIPGDINFSKNFNHYLVKLCLDNIGYSREVIEYTYYLTARSVGINMMDSKLIDGIHFATKRFDRQYGKKQHILTATGITGWDFTKPEDSSYENLFELALFIKVPHKDIEQLFIRMVFNIVFCNIDDHLKNHSFIYNDKTDKWNLSPAYDLTYALNPELNYNRVNRAMSICNKRTDIELNDILEIANKFTIKNPKKIIMEINEAIFFWKNEARQYFIPEAIIKSIMSDFISLK